MKKEWVILNVPTDIRTREYLYYILSILGYNIEYERLRDREWMHGRNPHLLHYPRAHPSGEWIVGPFHNGGPDKKWQGVWPEYTLYSYPEALKLFEEQLNIYKNEENTKSDHPIQDSNV